MVPCYFHPSVYLSTPEVYNPGAVPLSSVAFSQYQSERSYNSYCRYNPVETNACKIEVLEKTSTVHSSSGQKTMVGSCQFSNSSEKSRFTGDVAQLMASSDHSDARSMEQREKSVEDKFTVLNASRKPGCDISEFNASTSCSVLSKTSYLSALELNLTKENMSSSPGEAIQPAQKEQKKDSILPKDETEKDDTSLHTNADFPLFSDSDIDEDKYSDFDDDSQIEYHSAEDEGCVCHGKQETKNSETFKDKNLANEGHHTDGQQCFNKLENAPSTSVSHTLGNYFNNISELPCTFRDGKCTACNFLSSVDQGRDETVGSFYTVSEELFNTKANEEKNPELFSTSKVVIDEKVVADCFTDITLMSTTDTKRDSCEQTDYSSTGVFDKTGDSHLQHQERTFSPLAHMSGGEPEMSDPCVYDECIVANAKGKNSTYKSCGHCGRYTKNFPNSELKCITYLNNIASKSRSAVTQAVDASSDFRACFTTSRATNVKVPVVSRGQNTAITMMSKLRPKEWLTENYRSVACNTDWSCVSGNVDMADSQIAFENYATKHGCQSKNKNLFECKNSTMKDFGEIPESSSSLERMMQQSQEIVSHSPNCCKEIWQRAMKAEMELLKIRYQMHHQHCRQTCSSVLEEKQHVNSSCGPGTSESWPQNVETSFHPLVEHALSENSSPQLCPSKRNSGERSTSHVENRLSHTQEISENWFDATENLAVTGSPLSHSETQTTEDRKKVSNNMFCIHVGNLSALVSEVDLHLCFRKYNVSKILIAEHSDNYRYAILSFKTACDAKRAVKEINEKEIKGKAVKVRLVKIPQENSTRNCQNVVKQQSESQTLHSSSKKNKEHGKNSSAALKVPASASSDFTVPGGGTISNSKIPDVSKNSFKLSLPPSVNIPKLISAPSKPPRCTSVPSKVPGSDSQSFKPTRGSICFEIDQEDIADGLLPLGSVQCTPDPSSTFVPPNTLNLRSFCKIVKKLEELHPELSRDAILNALTELKEKKGSLSGLPLSTIVQMTSSLLNKKITSNSDGNRGNNLKKK